MDNINISELASQAIDALQELGYSSVMLKKEQVAFSQIVKYHKRCGKEKYDLNVLAEYVNNVENRVQHGELGLKYSQRLKRAVERLKELHDTSKLKWTPRYQWASQIVSNNYFEEILAEISSQSQ